MLGAHLCDDVDESLGHWRQRAFAVPDDRELPWFELGLGGSHRDGGVGGVNGQKGNNGDPDPSPNHPLNGTIVMGPEDIVGCHPETFETTVDTEAARVVFGLTDHGLTREGEQIDGAGGKAGLDYGDMRISAEVSTPESRIYLSGRECKIDLPTSQRPDAKILLVFLIDQGDLDPGRFLVKPAQCCRQHPSRDRLESTDSQVAGNTPGKLVEITFGGLQPLDELASVAKQQCARWREAGRSRPRRSIEQWLANELFESGDLLRHRRLGEPQPAGGPTKRAFLGDRPQGQQMASTQITPHAVIISITNYHCNL